MIAALLLVAGFVAVSVGNPPRVISPYGTAANGVIAYDMAQPGQRILIHAGAGGTDANVQRWLQQWFDIDWHPPLLG